MVALRFGEAYLSGEDLLRAGGPRPRRLLRPGGRGRRDGARRGQRPRPAEPRRRRHGAGAAAHPRPAGGGGAGGRVAALHGGGRQVVLRPPGGARGPGRAEGGGGPHRSGFPGGRAALVVPRRERSRHRGLRPGGGAPAAPHRPGGSATPDPDPEEPWTANVPRALAVLERLRRDRTHRVRARAPRDALRRDPRARRPHGHARAERAPSPTCGRW